MSIHPTAIVARGAELGADVDVGPYAVIGPGVRIGDGTRIMAHAHIDGDTTLGAGCQVFPFCSLGTPSQDLKYGGGRSAVSVGDHTTLREYVTVNGSTAEDATTRVGNRCHILAYCHVAHECTVGDGVVMSNCTQLAGHVIVEDDVGFGGMTGVHQFVRIGALSFIGGFTRIAQDVPPYFLAEGNPAVVHGVNSVGLRRREWPAEVRDALKDAYRILYREGLSTSQAVERIRRDLPRGVALDHLLAFVQSSERGIIK